MELDTPPASQPRGVHAGEEEGEEADPIIASYDIYTNPSLPSHRRLLILQYPNKQGANRRVYDQLSEVRIKPRSGMFEVDVPISHANPDYDRDKGLRWGGALSKSTAAKSGGTHGLAGGFGVGVPANLRGAGGGAGSKRRDDFDVDMMDWTEAVRQDKVLRTQTLGGQFPLESPTDCRWMIGTFKGNQLHLTPATSLIHLRPQLHHLDATTEQERLSRPREGAAATAVAASGGSKDGAAEAGASSGGSGGPQQTARAIHMSIKSAATGSGELTTETMADRLRVVQLEPWSKLRYKDDEDPTSWHMFTDNLVYKKAPPPPPQNPGPPGTKGDAVTTVHDKGKEREAQREQRLKAKWVPDEFLRQVSGMRDGPDADDEKGYDSVIDVEKEKKATAAAAADAAKKGTTTTNTAGKGKGRAAAATTAATGVTTTTAAGGAGGSSSSTTARNAASAPARRGGKGKSVAFKRAE